MTYEEELKRIKAKYETQRKMGNNKQNTLVQQQSNPVVQQPNPQEVAVQNADNLNGWEKFNAGLNRVGTNLQKGIIGAFEGVMDTGLTIGANIGKRFGADTTDLENFIKTDYATQLAEQRVETGNKKVDNFINKIVFNHGLPDVIEAVSGSDNGINYMGMNTKAVRDYSNSGQALPNVVENLSQGVGSALGFATLGAIAPQNAVGQFGTMFLSSGGKGVEESLNEGHTLGQATAYGTMSGVVEARTEALVGKGLKAIGLGTGKFAGVLGKSTSKTAKEVTGSVTRKGMSTVVKNLLKNFNEEGTEEVVSDLINPLLKQIAYGDDRGYLQILQDNGGWNGIVQSYIYGGLSGMLFEGVQATSIVKNYGFDGYYLSDVANQMGEANQELKNAVKSGNANKIAKAQQNIINIQENNQQMFNQYVNMLNELKQKTGFDLNNYIDDNGTLQVNKLSKIDNKIIGKQQLYKEATNVKTLGETQDELIKEVVDKYNKNNEDKINYKSVNNDEFIKIQQDNNVKEVQKNANAFVVDGQIYVNKDSKAYKNGTLFATVGHEIMHGLEKTSDYYNMFNNVWNNMSKTEQDNILSQYAERYKSQNLTKIGLKKEWFADYIGENSLMNYKQFSKQIKKTNPIARAIAKWRDSITVKSALDERRTTVKAENKADYEVDTENATKTATKQELAYQMEEDNEEQYSNEFRRLQEESNRISNEELQRYRNGSQKISDELYRRLSNIFKRELEARRRSNSNRYGVLNLEGKGNSFKVYANVDAKTFHDVFEISRNYLENGELVDLHDVDDYKNTTNYLSNDGLSGFAITKQGDLISVFNVNRRRGFLRAIANLVENNAKTLDCYVSSKQNLQSIYSKTFGFKTASVMDYNMEYDHDGIAKNHNMPKVAFMVNTKEEIETKTFNKDQYDEAKQYQLDSINPNPTKNTDIRYQLTPTDEKDYEVLSKQYEVKKGNITEFAKSFTDLTYRLNKTALFAKISNAIIETTDTEKIKQYKDMLNKYDKIVKEDVSKMRELREEFVKLKSTDETTFRKIASKIETNGFDYRTKDTNAKLDSILSYNKNKLEEVNKYIEGLQTGKTDINIQNKKNELIQRLDNAERYFARNMTDEIEKQIREIAGDISKLQTQEDYYKLVTRIYNLGKAEKKAQQDLSGVTKAKEELTGKYNNVISQIKEKLSIDDLHTLLQRQSKEEIRSIKAKIKTRQDKIAEYEEKLKTETNEEKISNLKTGIEDRKQQISKFELDIDVLEKKIDKIQGYSLEQSLDELKYIENKIKNVKSVNDIIAETLKEEGYSTLKEEIEADIKSLEDFVESVETKQTNKQEKILKDIYSSHESFIKKTYKSQSITNYEEFMKEYDKNLSSIKTQLKENGMTDEEIDNELKSFDTVLDIVKKHFDSYENLGKSFGKKRYNEVVKPLLNNIISIENLEVEDDVKSMTESIDRIDKVYNELVSPKLDSLKADFEKTLAKKDTDKIAEIHNNIENIYQGLKKWLVPIYNKYSEDTEYHQEEYKAFESAVDDIGILAEEYDVNSPTVKEALKVNEVADKIETNTTVSKQAVEQQTTVSKEEIEKKVKKLKPKKVIVEKVVYKPIKDGVRKKSVESAKSVKDYAQAHGDYYYELNAVDDLIDLITTQAKDLGLNFRFYFDESEGKEIVSAEIHKILNNYNGKYGNVEQRTQAIFNQLIKGSEMKLPNINGEITWQKISLGEKDSLNVEKRLRELIKESVANVIENSAKPTILARAITNITKKYQKMLKDEIAGYEILQKEVAELKEKMNNTSNMRANNTGVDKKIVNDLTKQISELREQVESMMSTPVNFSNTDERTKFNNRVKELKEQVATLKRDYKKAEKLAIKQSTKIAYFRNETYGKKRIGFEFRNKLTKGLKEVFGKQFEIDNKVFINTSTELSKGHIDKATDIFFDYLKQLKTSNEKISDETSISIPMDSVLDDVFKEQLKQMFEKTYNEADLSNVEELRLKLKAKIKEAKDKLKLQTATFTVANQILNQSQTIEKKLKKKGGVQPLIATEVIAMAKKFANISRNKLFTTEVRKAIYDFDDYVNSTVEGQDTTVLENLGLSMPVELTSAIKELRKYKDEKTVSLEEMSMYNGIVSMINKFIDRANPTKDVTFTYYDKTGKKVEQTKMAYEWAEESIEKQKYYTEKLGKQSWFMKKFVDPRLVFKHLAGYDDSNIYNLLYEELQDDQTKYEENYMNLQNIITKYADSNKENKNFLKSFNKKVEIEGVNATIGQFLSLYKLIRREQGRKHLLNTTGGFTIDSKMYSNFDSEASLDKLKTSIEEKFNMNDSNSPASEFIKMTNDFFEQAKKLKYNTDMDLKGYSNVEEGEYFPIKISALSKIQVLDNSNYFDPLSMQGARSYKFNENVKGASGSMEIGDVYDIMNSHLRQVSLYNAYSKTLDQFQSLYNLKLSKNEQKGISSGDSLGLATKLRFKTNKDNVYQLDSYLNTLFGDIQGVSKVETNSTTNLINRVFAKIRGKFASFQLGANLKVMASQLASIPASMKYINARYLVQAIGTNTKMANMPELPQIAQYRKASKQIVYANTLSDSIGKVGEALSKGIQFTDSRAINVLWKASLLQTRNEDGTYNTEKATALFTKAVRETQPNYSALDRSELLRSKSELVKAVTMFTTQPSKNFTNFVEAFSIIKTKKKLGEKLTREDKKYMKDTITGLLVQGAVYSAIGWLFNKLLSGWEDDDKDDNEVLNFAERFVNDNILGMIPFANNFDIDFDTMKPTFNDYELGSLETINDMVSNINSIVGGNFNPKTFIDTIGMATGIPTNNLYRYSTGGMKLFKQDEFETIFESWYKGYKNNDKSNVNKALEVGNVTRARTYYKKYLGNTFNISQESTNTMFDLYSKGKSLNTKSIPKNYTVNDNEYEIDTAMFKDTYSKASDTINKLNINAKFNRLNDDEKTYILNKVLTAYFNKALAEQTEYEMKPIDIVLTSNIQPKHLVHLAKISSIEATEKKTKKELVTAYISKQQLSADEKYLLYMLAGYKVSDTVKRRIKVYARRLGLKTKEINQLFKED